MSMTTDRPIRYPTREELDAAWDRSVERYGETNLEAVTDLLTIANGIANLRVALEFYANETNYLDGVPGEWVGPMAFDDPSSDFDYDMGERARKALKGGSDD